MAAKHSVHVALTEKLLKFIDDEVASGDYASNSEVVRAALRLMVERKQIETMADPRPGFTSNGLA